MAMFSRRSAADFLTSLAKNQGFRFWRDTRAAATALMGVAVVIMSVGAGAFISDHLWVVDQRDKLKSATDAASVAAMVEMNDILLTTPDIGDSDLHAAVEAVARRYVIANLGDLPPDRYAQAVESLQLEVTVSIGKYVGAHLQADSGPGRVPLRVHDSAAERSDAALRRWVSVQPSNRRWTPTHIVLAIDTSKSMTERPAMETITGPGEASKGELTRDAAQGVGRYPESERE